MSESSVSADVRATIEARRDELHASLTRHHAINPRLFGSIARGEATAESDIDVLVDLLPSEMNPLMRLAGLSEEFREILDRNVDVVAADMLKAPVTKTAVADAIAL